MGDLANLEFLVGWLSREIVEFGLRWIVVGVAVLGFGGWLGSRYRSTKKKLAALQDEMNKRPPIISMTRAEYEKTKPEDGTIYLIPDDK